MKAQNIETILVPVDFSEISLSALETAIKISARQNATITIVNVVEPIHTSHVTFATGMLDNAFNQLQDDSKANLKAIADKIKISHHVHLEIHSTTGVAYDGIVDAARKLKSNLIVMGTHGISGIREFFIGSNAYSVVKHAPCPVLTVPPGKPVEGFKNIIFPIRLIPHALEKFEFAKAIIKKNSAMLHVIELISAKEKTEKAYSFFQGIDAFLRNLERENINYTHSITVAKDLAKKTLTVAHKEKADLIIATADIDFIFNDFFVGPFVQKIVHHSKIPVLSVRPVSTN